MDWQILPFDMLKDFQCLAKGCSVNVPANTYRILRPTDTETHLLMENTNVCAGVIIVPENPQGNIGMLHVLSEESHHRHGQEAVKSHVQRGWKKFIEDLSPGSRNLAVTFGGRNDKVLSVEAEKASQWTNDTIGECVKGSPFIHSHTDFRYQNSPHSAVVARDTGQIAVGHTWNHGLLNPYTVWEEPRDQTMRMCEGIKITYG